MRSDVAYALGGEHGPSAAEHDAAIARANAAVGELHRTFFATPYRPTGLGTEARMLVRLVDELNWLNAIILQAAPTSAQTPANRAACGVRSRAALVLESGAGLLDEREAGPRRCRRRWLTYGRR